MKRATEIADAAESLPNNEKLWLIERLVRSLRGDSQSPRPTGDLRAMAQDPQIQRELAAIEEEFSGTELDGLNTANAT